MGGQHAGMQAQPAAGAGVIGGSVWQVVGSRQMSGVQGATGKRARCRTAPYGEHGLTQGHIDGRLADAAAGPAALAIHGGPVAASLVVVVVALVRSVLLQQRRGVATISTAVG